LHSHIFSDLFHTFYEMTNEDRLLFFKKFVEKILKHFKLNTNISEYIFSLTLFLKNRLYIKIMKRANLHSSTFAKHFKKLVEKLT